MLENITIVFFGDFLSWKKEAKDIASPGLREGKIAIVEEKSVPRKEDPRISLKLIISWTDGFDFSSPFESENIINKIFGKANNPKIQGIKGSLKKKLYFRVNNPKVPEKTTTEKTSKRDCQWFSWKIKNTNTKKRTPKIKI